MRTGKKNMEQINWAELDKHWEQQFAEDFAEFLMIHGKAAA